MESFTLIRKNRAQIWGFDLMIALVIFLSGIVLIYLYAINFSDTSQDILNELHSESILVSSMILSEGSPDGWNLQNVEIPGILTENRLNQTKLELLNELVEEDYERTKIMLGAKNNFYFTFIEIEANGIPLEGVGKAPEGEENLIKIERVMVYGNKPVKFILYTWN